MGRRESQAVAFISAGRIDLAERLLRDQLKETPRSAEAHRLLAHCLRARRRLEASLDEADEALRLSPDSGLCHLERGRTLKDQERPVEAEAEMREALVLAPRSSFVHAILAGLLLDEGSPSDAIAMARAGLEISPDDPNCTSVIAIAQLRLHRIDAAHRTARDALANDPSRADLHNTLGIALRHMGAHDAAVVEFGEALRLNPLFTAAESNLRASDQARNGFKTPYPARFTSAWTLTRWRRRVALLATLALLGFIWPGFWGAMTYPLGREIRRPLARYSQSLAASVHLAVWLGPAFALLLLFLGTAHSAATPAVAPCIPFTFTEPFAWPSDIQLPADWPCSLNQSIPSDIVYDPDRQMAFSRFLTGVFLLWAVMPAMVTSGRARRIALGFAAAAAFLALCGALPGADPVESGVCALAVGGCAYFAGKLVYATERAGWSPTIPPNPASHEAGASIWRS